VSRAQTEAPGTVNSEHNLSLLIHVYFSYMKAWQQQSMSVYKNVNALKSTECSFWTVCIFICVIEV